MTSFLPEPSDERTVRFDVYDILGSRAAIGAAGDLHDAVRSIFAGFSPCDLDLDAMPRYELAREPDAWHVRANDSTVYIDSSLEPALGMLEWAVATAALALRNDLFQMHAASLCAPTRRAGVILLGNSGAGKTTLTLALMHRGFIPYGDDVALVGPGSLELQPFRRSFHTSSETWRLISPLAGGGDLSDTQALPAYFVPPQWAERPAPVEWLFFLERRLTETPRVEPLSPGEAAAQLVAHTLSLANEPRLALAVCAKLTAKRCCRLIVNDLAETAAVVQRLVSATPAGGA